MLETGVLHYNKKHNIAFCCPRWMSGEDTDTPKANCPVYICGYDGKLVYLRIPAYPNRRVVKLLSYLELQRLKAQAADTEISRVEADNYGAVLLILQRRSKKDFSKIVAQVHSEMKEMAVKQQIRLNKDTSWQAHALAMLWGGIVKLEPPEIETTRWSDMGETFEPEIFVDGQQIVSVTRDKEEHTVTVTTCAKLDSCPLALDKACVHTKCSQSKSHTTKTYDETKAKALGQLYTHAPKWGKPPMHITDTGTDLVIPDGLIRYFDFVNDISNRIKRVAFGWKRNEKRWYIIAKKDADLFRGNWLYPYLSGKRFANVTIGKANYRAGLISDCETKQYISPTGGIATHMPAEAAEMYTAIMNELGRVLTQAEYKDVRFVPGLSAYGQIEAWKAGIKYEEAMVKVTYETIYSTDYKKTHEYVGFTSTEHVPRKRGGYWTDVDTYVGIYEYPLTHPDLNNHIKHMANNYRKVKMTYLGAHCKVYQFLGIMYS